MNMEESQSCRQRRAELAGTIYVDLVEFAACVPPIPLGWNAGAAGISATIIDGLAAVVELINGNGQAHAATVCRGMIESLLDLALLCENPDYVRSMILATQTGVKRRLERELALNGLVSGTRDQVQRDLAAVNAQLATLKEDKVKAYSIADKFMAAPKSYQALQHYYDRWNSYVHNNVEAVMNRHFRGGHLQLGDTLADDEAQELLIIASGIAIETVTFAHRYSSQLESFGTAERVRLLQRVELIRASRDP